MSTYYSIFAEVRVQNKWSFLGPYVHDIYGRIHTLPVIAGKSMMREAYEELRDCIHSIGLPADMSEEMQELFKPAAMMKDFSGKTITHQEYYKNCAFVVSFEDTICRRIKKDRPFQYSGYVNKRLIAAFETDEYQGIEWWLSPEEYKALPEKEKKTYQYYEWNDSDGWYGIYTAIYQRVSALLDWFTESGIPEDYPCNYEDRNLSRADVRLIVCTE